MPSASAPWTCRSTGCATRSSVIRAIRLSFRPCAAWVTGLCRRFERHQENCAMTSFDDGIGRLRVAAEHVVTAASAVKGAAGYITGPITTPWDRFTRWLKSVMPKGLYARALLIIIIPMVVLQSVVAFMFVERQSSLVTHYLSSAVTQEIATLIDVYKTYPQG